MPPIQRSLKEVYKELLEPYTASKTCGFLIDAYDALFAAVDIWNIDLALARARVEPWFAQRAQEGRQQAIASRLGVPLAVIAHYLRIGFLTPADIDTHYEFGEESDPLRVRPVDVVAAQAQAHDGIAPSVAAVWLGLAAYDMWGLLDLQLLDAVSDATLQARGGARITPVWPRAQRRFARARRQTEGPPAVPAPRAPQRVQPVQASCTPNTTAPTMTTEITTSTTMTSAGKRAPTRPSVRWIDPPSLWRFQREMLRRVRRQYLPASNPWRFSLRQLAEWYGCSSTYLLALVHGGEAPVYRDAYERTTSLGALCMKDDALTPIFGVDA